MSSFNSSQLAVVLVAPRQPGNIGAVCRAMANFGVQDLRLVTPCDRFHPEAVKFAVAAKNLLGEATLYPSLNAALADLHLSIALTRRAGRLRGTLPTIDEMPPLLAALPANSRVGLVFGREDSGLSTNEVACCSHAASIATIGKNGSLNLAQAAVVTLYALTRQRCAPPPDVEVRLPLPTHAEVEPLLRQLEELADLIGYNNPSRPEVIGHSLRQLLARAQPDEREFNLLRGLLAQLCQSVQG